MRKTFLTAIITTSLIFSTSVQAEYVSGYTRKDGTYVQPHQRTNSNNTMMDNYSTKGNSNPYTGKAGTVDPYKPQNTYNNGYSNKYMNTGR